MFRDAWALAIEGLCLIELTGVSERLALIRASRKLEIRDPSAIGLAHRLVIETVRRQNFLDYLISSILKTASPNDFHPRARAFLRLYAYQIKFEGNDSYEKAARVAGIGRSIVGWQQLKKAEEVMGILLSVKPEEVLKGLSEEEKVSLKMFQPLWFVKYCYKLLGRHQALQFIESMVSDSPTYIRINTQKMSEEELLEEIGDEGVPLEKVEGLKYTYKVTKESRPVVRTNSFKEGLFFVQDKASCLAAEVANPQPDMTVLDVCAAPGAKTSHLIQLMENKGVVYSVDYSRRRMKVWRREIGRMGVRIAEPLVADAYNSLPIQNVEADIVLLDPPCTSTGAFSRIPSAKWRLSRRPVRNMVALQWKMLNNCAELVKKGGHLIYSTCSVTVEENEMLIERFLKWNPDYALTETKPRIGLPGLRGLTESQRLYPHIHQCNGFFIAKLAKRN